MNKSTTTLRPTQFTLHPTVAQDDRSPRQRYRDGFDAFCRGASVSDLYDPDEIRGWWSALDSAAEAGMPGHADAHGF